MDMAGPNSNIYLSSLNLQQPKTLVLHEVTGSTSLKGIREVMLVNFYTCFYLKKTKIKLKVIFMEKFIDYQQIIQLLLIFKKSGFQFWGLFFLFFNRETRKSKEQNFSPIFSNMQKKKRGAERIFEFVISFNYK